MKVLVIPEDPLNDQYILKPVVERIFADLERPARIEILQSPRLRGIDEALNEDVVRNIVNERRMFDLVLLIVDRDCNRYNNEQKAKARQEEHSRQLLTCLAIEEVEVWMLSVHRDTLQEPWRKILAECDPKEVYAEPFLKRQGWTISVGKGRKRAMHDLDQKWKTVLKSCPEITDLKKHIAIWLKKNGS
jgi:hypothetical protein